MCVLVYIYICVSILYVLYVVTHLELHTLLDSQVFKLHSYLVSSNKNA